MCARACVFVLSTAAVITATVFIACVTANVLLVRGSCTENNNTRPVRGDSLSVPALSSHSRTIIPNPSSKSVQLAFN